MAEVARLAGVSVTTVSHVINGTRPASERTRERVLAAIERTGYRPNTIARALPYLETQGVPTVLLDRFLDVALDQVGCDNEQPTARLVEHLIDLGHTRIAMAIGIPGLSTTDERVRGYRLALERGGLTFDPELV